MLTDNADYVVTVHLTTGDKQIFTGMPAADVRELLQMLRHPDSLFTSQGADALVGIPARAIVMVRASAAVTR